MKKTVCVLLALTLLALAACGGPVGAAPAPSPAPAGDAPAPVSPGSAVPAAAALPGPSPWGEDRICFPLEYDFLYTMAADGGDPVLLNDMPASTRSRLGDTLLVSYDDGAVRSYNLRTGETKDLWNSGAPIYKLFAAEGGFTFERYSMIDGPSLGIYRESGDGVRMLEAGEGAYYTDSCLSGDRLLCRLYENEGGFLVCFDMDSLAELWRQPMSYDCGLWGDGNAVYLTVPENGVRAVYRVDPADGERVPTGVVLKKTDSTLLYVDETCALVESDYSDGFNTYLVRGAERTLLPKLGKFISYQLQDARDGILLLLATDYGESVLQTEDFYHFYHIKHYYRLDTAPGGELTELTLRGENGSLFAGGDFPVMDSSTARKPVTAELYSFFCENRGYGGAVPLCSTTHYAWLNIADKVADIALLAAPTQEERDYLAEKNVEVEMKLYGGDGLVFIGGKACGVENLSLDQLRGIFRGEITNWKELGGADHPIRVLYRDDQSGSQRLFEALLWKGETVPDLAALGFERLDEMSTIVRQVLSDPYSIGYSIMTYLRDVYNEEELLCFSLDGSAPTPENVAVGSYPLGTKGYVVIRSDEAPDSPARRLYDWFGTPVCDYILRSCSVTPLSE